MLELATCLHCGGLVPTRAVACVHCGQSASPRRNRLALSAFTLVGTGLSALTLMACYGAPPCDYVPLPDGGATYTNTDGGPATGYCADLNSSNTASGPDDGGTDAGTDAGQ